MDALLARITIDPAICHGKPCVRGLRYPVETLLELLSSGMTFDDILSDYEDLEREDLLAVLAFAARLSQTKGDPILDELHATRRQLLREHGGVAGLAAFLRQQEAKTTRPIAEPSDRAIAHKAASSTGVRPDGDG